jgi:hypothetical protein
MTRHRALLGAVFVLLLLCMQREALVHPFQHLGGLLHPAHERGLQAPVVDIACVECSLLASGTSVIPSGLAAVAPDSVRTERAMIAVASVSLAAPSYYSSRAPPPLI